MEKFIMDRGLKQDVIPAILFNIVLEYVIRRLSPQKVPFLTG
jgi:hypothetical protein